MKQYKHKMLYNNAISICQVIIIQAFPEPSDLIISCHQSLLERGILAYEFLKIVLQN